jgi:peptidoglycan hydrolase-like protein with peptidoglycan-binding domain
MRLRNPWPDGYTINTRSPYGYRVHPITGRRAFHHGVDVAGTFPVTSAGDGVVGHIGWNPTGGGHVVGIEHGKDLWTFYYHGRERTQLRQGQRVKAGDFIYTSGNTGASTGAHLHFETRKSRRFGHTIDPVPLLQKGTPLPILQVTGRPTKQTWAVWQEDLKARWGYTGRIDGIPGPMTYSAIQRWAGVPVNGRLDDRTRKATQTKLGVTPDGVWGRITWSEIQRQLNAGTL